jgi:hypothetical protein
VLCELGRVGFDCLWISTYVVLVVVCGLELTGAVVTMGAVGVVDHIIEIWGGAGFDSC